MQSVLLTLTYLVNGMLYSSESDNPFTVLEWGKINDSDIKGAIVKHYGSTAEPMPVSTDAFFNKYIHRMEMSGDDVMIATIKNYQKLYDFVKANFKHVDVYRCGSIRVGIYLVLKTKDDEVFVLSTLSIET